MKKTLCLILLALLSISLFAGPFGIEMGWSLEDLEASGSNIVEIEEMYGITAVMIEPKSPHPLFDVYGVILDADGICVITAASEDYSDSKKFLDSYFSVEASLERNYGKPSYQSIAREDIKYKYLILSDLYNEDIALDYDWTIDSAVNDTDIRFILLRACSESLCKAFFSLGYYADHGVDSILRFTGDSLL